MLFAVILICITMIGIIRIQLIENMQCEEPIGSVAVNLNVQAAELDLLEAIKIMLHVQLNFKDQIKT